MLNASIKRITAIFLITFILITSSAGFVVGAADNAELAPLAESFENIKLTTGSMEVPEGWMFSGVYGSATSAKIADRQDDTSKGKYLQIYHYTSKLNFGGATHLSGVKLEYKPIKISCEVFLHGAESASAQRIRVGILANRNTADVTPSVMIQFTRNEDGSWSASEIGSMETNRGMAAALSKIDGSKYLISQQDSLKWHKVDLLCYPDHDGGIGNVRYYVDGEELLSSNQNRSYTKLQDCYLGDFAYYSQTANDTESWFGIDTISVNEYDGEENEAYVKFGQNVIRKNIEMPQGSAKTSCTAENNLWRISNGYGSILYFPLNYSIGNSTDGSVYDVKITYTDKGEGYFAVWYDSIHYGKQLANIVYLIGDNQEKTFSLQLSDAAFAKGIDDKGDIAISLSETGIATGSLTTYSKSPLYINEFSIKKRNAKNPVTIESETNINGNTFSYFDNEKLITNIIRNVTDRNISTKLTYRLENKDKETVFVKESLVDLTPGEVMNEVVNIGEVEKCGIYSWHVDSDTNGVEFTFDEDTVCIVKTDPMGINSEFAWINYYIDDPAASVRQTGMDLLKKANIAGARTIVLWSEVIDSTGNFAQDFWQTEPGKRIKLFRDNNIPHWIMLLGKNYCIPTDNEELAGWKEFCKYVMRNTYQDTKVYEIWNEPDLFSFNRNEATPADLAKITNLAKQAATEIENEMSEPGNQYKLSISGLSVTGLWLNDRRDYWLKEALDAGIAGGEYGMDMLNVHTYVENAPPESAKLYNTLKEYQSDIEKNCDVSNMPVLISEYGYPSSDSKVGSNKADWIVRSALLYKANGVGDMSALYNLERRGILDTNREDCFGIISYLNEKYNNEGKTGIPNDSYLAYAGMNYVLGGKITDSKVIREDNVQLLRFTSSKFGTDVYAMWALEGSDSVTVDLGCKHAVLYDSYGNETQIESVNGLYNVSLGQSVKYIRAAGMQTLIDQNGEEISFINDDTLKIGVKFAVSEYTKNAKSIIAFYDSNGKLLETHVQSVDNSLGTVFCSDFVNIPDRCYSVKAFVWSNDNKNVPILPYGEVRKKYKSVMVFEQTFDELDSSISGNCSIEQYNGDTCLRINGNGVASVFINPEVYALDENLEYIDISVDAKMTWDFDTNASKRLDLGLAFDDENSSRMLLTRFYPDGNAEISIASTADPGMGTTTVGISSDAKKLYHSNEFNRFKLRYYPRHPDNPLKGAYELYIMDQENGGYVKLFDNVRAAAAPKDGMLGKVYFGAIRSGTTYFDNLVICKMVKAE